MPTPSPRPGDPGRPLSSPGRSDARFRRKRVVLALTLIAAAILGAVLTPNRRPSESERTLSIMAWATVQRQSAAMPVTDLDELVGLLESPDPRMRTKALRNLGRFEPGDRSRAVPSMVRLLQDSDEEIRAGALTALSEIPDDAAAIRALLDFLKGDGPLRERVPWLLSRGARAERIRPALLEAARSDPAPRVRHAAERALTMLAEIQPALQGLDSDDAELRRRAISALRGRRHPSPEILAGLAARLSDPAAEVRLASLGALTTLGPAAEAAVPDLLRLRASAGDDLAPAVERALAATGGVVAQLRRDGCRSRCPVYRVTVFPDGSVTYVGHRFVEALGRRQHRLDREELEAVRAGFERIGFERLDQRYWTGSLDRPMITLTRGDRTVHFQPATPTSPNRAVIEALVGLAAEFDEITGSARWVVSGPTAAGSDGERAQAPGARPELD